MKYDSFWILDFPLAPSVNTWLKTNRKGQFFKSKIWREYRTHANWWYLQHKKWIDDVRVELRTLLANNYTIRVDCYFCFAEHKYRKVDPDNYLKATLDALSHMLGIDDSLFYSGYREKVIAETRDGECAVLMIRAHKPRSKRELIKSIKGD